LWRRRSAASNADGNAGPDPRLATLAASLWTEQHDKEMERQRTIREGRARQAAVEGLVVDNAGDVQAQIAAERAAQVRRQKKLDANHQRV
jgi:hypothetical protein